MRNPKMQPLKKRMNQTQLENRAAKMIARRQVAETLQAQMGNVLRGAMGATEPLRRGFWGRMKWMLFGK